MPVTLFIVRPTPNGRWRREDTGEESTAPADFGEGAMWPHRLEGEDGWYVRLPNRSEHKFPVLWHTRQRASGSGARWAVEGEPPYLTVTPSINAGVWHGWIIQGELRDA